MGHEWGLDTGHPHFDLRGHRVEIAQVIGKSDELVARCAE
jgi:hypothetical protein